MTTSRVCVRWDAPRLGSLSLLAIAVAASLPAVAQQPAAPQAGQEEIIVTGSRVSRSGFDSSQPLTTIDSQQIENLGLVNVGDVVRTLPQNTPFFTETNVGIGNFNVGAQLANLRGLNPFFGTRTLTLIDTRRVVPTTEGGAVDLTLIPSMLVERTEVVTGGASAQYGSDAIAGVVNVILDKDLEGFKAQVDYGETAESDGGDTHASFAWGTASATTAAATCSRASSTNSRTPSGLARTTATGAPKGGGSPKRPANTATAESGRSRILVIVPEREADGFAIRRHQSCLTRRRTAPPPLAAHVRCRRHGGLAVQSRVVPGVGFRDAHRRRRHAARVRHVEHPSGGRALLGDGARELRRQRPAQLVRRGRLLEQRRVGHAGERRARSDRATRSGGQRVSHAGRPAALGGNGRATCAQFHAGRDQRREHDRERDDTLRDGARGRARQRVDVGRLLPARQEREPSAADQQHGRRPRGRRRQAARLLEVGARRGASNPANREPDRLPRDDTRSGASPRTRPAACR